MPDISVEIDSIETDIRGENVRDSAVSAIKKINTEGLNTVDEAPVEGSIHPALSGGIYSAIEAKKSETNIITVEVDDTGWSSTSPFTKIIEIPDITSTTKIDIIPNITLLELLLANNIASMWFENDNGTVSLKIIGETVPSITMVLKCQLLEGESVNG